jgi:organic hydroperoxide reductase OsmC/OhrA
MMENYLAKVEWFRGDQKFADNRYSRRHKIEFDGGASITASSSPYVVPVPYSDIVAIDPEEMFVASLSSCHMLWFLSIAAKAGFIVDSYLDNAEGKMEKNTVGKLIMSQVILKPHATFSGNQLPSISDVLQIHHQAHEECFIANSVKTNVVCEPIF